jgi:hypothetical protein
MVLKSFIACSLPCGTAIRHDLNTQDLYVKMGEGGDWVNVGPSGREVGAMSFPDLQRLYEAAAFQESVRQSMASACLVSPALEK